MRLVIIISHFNPAAGGAERFAALVAAGLVQRGHDVHIVAQDGVPVKGVPLHTVPRDRIMPEIQALAPDLTIDWGLLAPVDVHRLGGGLTAEFLHYNLLPHHPLLRWGKGLLYRFSGKQRRIIRQETELLQDPATQMLAVSEFVAAQVRRQIPGAESRLCVLHNGVDIHRFTPDNRREHRPAVRAKLGLTEEQTAFLFVAHNPKLKNFPLLKRIFAEIATAVPSAVLVVAGRHRPPGSAPWLKYAGAVEDMASLYAAVDVLLHPTCYDACANVVLEALAAGLPVLSSNLNGSAEVMTHGESGFVLPVSGLAPERIQDAWAEPIRRLAVDREERLRIGTAARQVAEQHSMEKYLQALSLLIEHWHLSKVGR